MKKLVLLCAFVLLASCQATDTTNNNKVLDNITYFKDPKTGLCFASVSSSTYTGYKVTSITCVPCEALIKIGIK